jgi:hypothetical protein
MARAYALAFLFAPGKNNARRAVGCGPTGLHQLGRLRFGFSFFDLDSLCHRLCLGKGFVQVSARNMGCQGMKSASPTRVAPPLSPQLAQKQLSGGYKASEVRPEAVIGDLAKGPNASVLKNCLTMVHSIDEMQLAVRSPLL